MIGHLRKLDTFSSNIILVFLGTSLVNLFNLVYQLIIAHRLIPADFAAFNSLLSIFILISSPIGTLQPAIAKYIAEFNAQGQADKVRCLLSELFKKTLVMAVLTSIVLFFFSFYIMRVLKISSAFSGSILACLLGISWIIPVFMGGIQGLELFKWFVAVIVSGGLLKLLLTVLFVWLGFNVPGALAAILFSSLFSIIICWMPLKKLVSLKKRDQEIDFKGIYLYLLPVAISTFCFIALVSFDMVMVKYFFSPEESGVYSLAQMVGKIFLFLPGAISLVMFPHTAGLKAKNMDTTSTLKKSLLYAGILAVVACAFYNIFPNFVLKILTGKQLPDSVLLGRYFSVSMTFFTLLNILIYYFLSLRNLKFIKWLVLFTFLQFLCIGIFHSSLIQVQSIICVNSFLLLVIFISLVDFS